MRMNYELLFIHIQLSFLLYDGNSQLECLEMMIICLAELNTLYLMNHGFQIKKQFGTIGQGDMIETCFESCRIPIHLEVSYHYLLHFLTCLSADHELISCQRRNIMFFPNDKRRMSYTCHQNCTKEKISK